MLRTIKVDPLVANLILVDKDSTIDMVGDSKVDGLIIVAKMAKSKSKNLVKPFLAKS